MQPDHANGWLKQLAAARAERELRGGAPAAQKQEAEPEHEPEQKKWQKKEVEPEQKRRKRVQAAKAPVAETHESVRSNAEVIDLCVSGESDCESVVILDDCEQTDSLGLAQASHGLAMQLQQEESRREQADSLALARLLQDRESAGEGPAHSPSHSRSVTGYSTGSLPWPSEVTWQEQQHGTGPRTCGNFNLCDQGATYFACKALNETTGHGVTPVPLPAQTIKICRMDGVRVVTARGHERKQRPGIDGKITTVCVCAYVRKRERERDRQTDRQTERARETTIDVDRYTVCVSSPASICRQTRQSESPCTCGAGWVGSATCIRRRQAITGPG
jgi:hypothetical protein